MSGERLERFVLSKDGDTLVVALRQGPQALAFVGVNLAALVGLQLVAPWGPFPSDVFTTSLVLTTSGIAGTLLLLGIAGALHRVDVRISRKQVQVESRFGRKFSFPIKHKLQARVVIAAGRKPGPFPWALCLVDDKGEDAATRFEFSRRERLKQFMDTVERTVELKVLDAVVVKGLKVEQAGKDVWPPPR